MLYFVELGLKCILCGNSKLIFGGNVKRKTESYSTNKTYHLNSSKNLMVKLRGPSTLTWELQTGDSKTTLEDKTKIGNVTYYISSESLRDAESE